MTHRGEQALSLACVADQSGPAAALHEALVCLFPTATVTRLDTSIEQVVPDAVDCAVVAAEVNGIAGLDVLRLLRARGYAGPAVVITDGSLSMPPTDEASARRLGARLCSRQNELVTPLALAVAEALHVEDGGVTGRHPRPRSRRCVRPSDSSQPASWPPASSIRSTIRSPPCSPKLSC